jgi:hypothetical protein
VNKKGHSQTLIAAHPGNRNAVKSGVHSPATLAPRIDELEVAIGERSSPEVILGVLRRELAGLVALVEAMDDSLASGGLNGRTGKPRTLINLRLRANDRLRQTTQQYAEAERSAPKAAEFRGNAEPDGARPHADSLTDDIARAHFRDSLAEITPEYLDPKPYLYAVITTTDPAVRTQDRHRASRMLTKWCKNRSSTCVCFSTLLARDELELRAWIDEARAGAEPAGNDPELAAIVRKLAAGERLEWTFFRKTSEAVTEVLAEGVARTGNGRRRDGDTDPTVTPFWDAALSPRPDVSAKDRLDALAALDDAGALPRCTCKPEPAHQLREERVDAWYACTIRLVSKKHYWAALRIARYPETYLAVRDAIDARAAADLSASPEDHSDAGPWTIDEPLKSPLP